jgi:ubiquinone/menaquinone biosynthesis C-methylase UbiE
MDNGKSLASSMGSGLFNFLLFISVLKISFMSKLIEQYYDSLSSVYDQATIQFEWSAPQKLTEVCKKYCEDGLGHILDIGCGT